MRQKCVAEPGVIGYIPDRSEPFDKRGVTSDCDHALRRKSGLLGRSAGALLAACLLLGGPGCRDEPEIPALAEVGDRRLTQEDVDLLVPVQLMGRLPPQAKRRIVEAWVEEELLRQEALRLRIDEDPEVAARVSAAVRDLLVAELLERHFEDDAEVTEEEIQAYYDAHPEVFTREHLEIRARHILVAARSDLRRVQRELRNEAFDAVARESSIDASADVGGDLGYFTRNMVDPAFWEACEGAGLGRKATVRTPLGYHAVEVMDRREPGTVKDLMEVRGEIRQRILAERRQAKRRELLDDLRSRIPWRISESLIAPPAADEDETAGEPYEEAVEQ